MYVIREVLHCKPGTVRKMIEKFKQISTVMRDMLWRDAGSVRGAWRSDAGRWSY